VQESDKPLSTHVLQGCWRSHFSLIRQHVVAVKEALGFDVLTSFAYRVCKTGLASVGVGWMARHAAAVFLHSCSYLIFETDDLQRRALIKMLHCLACARLWRLGCDFSRALGQPGCRLPTHSYEKLFLSSTFVRQRSHPSSKM
jgi:hypothetical protein